MTQLFYRCLHALAAVVLAMALLGCKSAGDNGATPSGFPEVTIHGASANQVKTVVQEFFLKRGYIEAGTRHGYEMAFDKAVESGRRGKALRVRLRLHPLTDDSWKLVGTPLGVEGWRSDLEAERFLPQGASQIQGFLVEIKSRLESRQ